MTIGIISNSALAIPLFHYLKNSGIDLKVYVGGNASDTSDIDSLISFCSSVGIEFHREKDPHELYPWFEKHLPDQTFVYGYRSSIDTNKIPANKNVFNIHPGTLPEFRGPQPVFWQLKMGVENLGLSIHLLTEKLDRGAIVWSTQIPNEPHLTHGLVDFLFSNLLIGGVNYILGAGSVEKLMNTAVQQDESMAVFYKRPVLKDVLINWDKMTAEEIINLVKACNPWNTGPISIFQSIEVKIVDAEVGLPCVDGVEAGTIIDTRNGIRVKSSDELTIVVNLFQINRIFVPWRYSEKFGLTVGQKFISPDLNSSDII